MGSEWTRCEEISSASKFIEFVPKSGQVEKRFLKRSCVMNNPQL